MSSVWTSRCEIVARILDAGANLNTIGYGRVPLNGARNVHVARLLLEAGADINATDAYSYISSHSSARGPALIGATALNNTALVRYLIEEGADVNLSAATMEPTSI